ncbi:MAG TPA: tRNA lysidine(34) synthetase TilS, partial [Roseiflexaceae bacterium]|nr:tRNA lysidine(34) synthetase TilS [Roseiflexaceae bacterium]
TDPIATNHAVVATVRASLLEHHMVEPGDTVVVAVSGGPDSLCLLHVLRALAGELGIGLHVAHLDHMLRGAQSSADAAFVAATARAWNLPATVVARDVRALAQATRGNLHQAGRVARYEFLAGVAQACGARAVAVAHNADDQAETVLMHLLRGAGPAGLRGMRAIVLWEEWGMGAGNPYPPSPNPQPLLVRPLLQVPRVAIEAYCAAHGLQPRRDPTNQDRSATRNRIRHELLPRLIEYNPHIVEALGRTAVICADEHDLAEQALSAAWPALAQARPGAIDFDGGAWQALHPALQRAALRRAYALLGGHDTLDLAHIEAAQAVIAQGVGRRVELPGSLAIEVSYDGAFTVGAARELDGPQLSGDEIELAVPGRSPLARGWLIEAIVCAEGAAADTVSWEVDLDAGTIVGPLVVRRRRPGDRYHPAGGRGSRRLQDMFVDAKIPRALRAAWPIIVAGGAIVWAPGLRPAAHFAVSSATGRMLRLRIIGPTEEPRVE